ncbi:DUF2199 domain-containing protein [Hymenobacter sp. YC55]|uniref:DUF2199 domain-containing protein n=1 Tax=Hymenobacter sp. YC55 TaxID=3034019 RepID=UPI0023FA25E0|nr:DUF2199 domain-containing protein [Hymenobacter sp. YC55]MDF7814650.1 DUF2199 domain-containing protein [Hymenobacter sp. YC55]
MTSFFCACCGETHDSLPDIGFAKPEPYFDIPEAEREARVQLTSDTCIIDEEHYFIRGVLEIPVHQHEQSFGLGVWISQKKEHFYTYLENPDTAEIGPYFGWLCSRVPAFGDTYLLKTKAHFQGSTMRPSIELEPTDEPFAIAQREGISLERAWDIVHEYLPPITKS